MSTKSKKIAITLLFFFIAGLCEIGGGYLVWLWLRDGMSWMFGALGGFVLFLYGVVPTFQSSIVLKCSMEHSLRLGESIFIRIVPDKKIFLFWNWCKPATVSGTVSKQESRKLLRYCSRKSPSGKGLECWFVWIQH